MIAIVMRLKPEYLAFTVNLVTFLCYLWKWQEPGKTIYWLGATLLTVGLIKMGG